MAEHAGKGESGQRMYPLWAYIGLKAWDLITWPATVRELKRVGARRTGFMTWEFGPAEPPACYRSLIGVMVHGPGCTCPDGSTDGG
jgi:hypothetical protein